MIHYNVFDVVAVPFPYTDRNKSKKRPALVLASLNTFDENLKQSVCAMITSAKNKPWPKDTYISDLESAGLPAESVVRLKLFTIDHHIISKKVGTLSPNDQRGFKKNFGKVFSAL